jgi:hypothetical protein
MIVIIMLRVGDAWTHAYCRTIVIEIHSLGDLRLCFLLPSDCAAKPSMDSLAGKFRKIKDIDFTGALLSAPLLTGGS